MVCHAGRRLEHWTISFGAQQGGRDGPLLSSPQTCAGGRCGIVVQALPGATSVTVPKLPSTATPADVLGTSPLDAQVTLCEKPQLKTFDLCLRMAWGRPFKLAPK
jgi:hypothetical protein